MSSLELVRRRASSRNSAWLTKHTPMQAMPERAAGRGLVQLDDAYWGGRCRGRPARDFRSTGSIPCWGDVKNAIRGSSHAIRAKRLPRYLAEFSDRFNRRFDPASLLAGPATAAAAQTPPVPYRLVKLA